MYPHCIRLRGPWECEPLERSGGREGKQAAEGADLPAPCRMTLPCRWGDGGLADFAGRVRFTRSFGYPSRIDAHERLWLTFAGADRTAHVWLNELFLGRHEGADESFEFDVTQLLRSRNELKVEVESPAPNGGLNGDVALEVRCPAFLRDVRIVSTVNRREVDLRVTGAVVGASDLPLEVHLVLEGKDLVFRSVKPTAGGQPFELTALALPLDVASKSSAVTSRLYTVRVDLIQGPMIWYGVKESMMFQELRDSDDPAPLF